MILTCAAGVRPWCKNMTNVNAKSSLISHMEMMRPKLGIVAKLEWFSIEIVVSAEGVGLGILSVQREGVRRLVISCFLIPRTRARCPPGQTQTLIVIVGNYGKVLCGAGRIH